MHLSIIDFVFVPHVFYLKVSSSIFLIIRLFIVFLTQKKEEGWGGGGVFAVLIFTSTSLGFNKDSI